MASSSSSQSSKKRARLSLLDTSVNVRSLTRLLGKLNELSDDDKQSLSCAPQTMHKDLYTSYGHALTTINVPTRSGGAFDWEVAKPDAMLKIYLESPALSEYVVKALHEHGNDPEHP